MAIEARHSVLTPAQQNNASIIRKFFELGKRMRQNGQMTEGNYAEFCGMQYCDLLPGRKPVKVLMLFINIYIYLVF